MLATTADDRRYMARALQLADRGRFTTHPNPRVGCVLVRDGAIVGEGYHQRAGGPHAERVALAEAGAYARGATAYVTLEPCSHFGRTPPCADGLIEAGVTKVFAAMQDPNPLVAGQGLARLEAAGIDIHCGLMADQSAALNPGFIRRMEQGRPWVRCKLAMSLDGRTAMANGESQWITGPQARQDVQRLRARSDAMLTGIGTVLKDDPSLNVRIANPYPETDDAPLPQPLRVVLDSQLRMPVTAKMLSLPGDTLVVTGSPKGEKAAALQRAGAEILVLPGEDDPRVDLHRLLSALASREINEVMIEAGPTLAGAALAVGVVDEFIVYMASLLMGDSARGLLHLPGIDHMADAFRLNLTDLRMLGKDIRLTLTTER